MRQVDPGEEYGRRLAELKVAEARLAARDRRMVTGKIALGLVLVVVAAWLLRHAWVGWEWGLLPVAALVGLFVVHERVLRALQRVQRLRLFYERGVARLEDRWAGTGERGEQFLEDAHPYARDLDVFGKGGLFELLCTARTRAGMATLAGWLLAPASADEARRRQAGVAELRERLEFRERLGLAGEEVRERGGARDSPGPAEALLVWSEERERLNPALARVAAPVLAALWVASLVAWGVWGWSMAGIGMSLVNLALTYRFKARVRAAAARAEAAGQELRLLAEVYREIEAETFATEKLAALAARMRQGGTAPSRALAELARRVDWLDSGDNWFVKAMEPFVFWTPQWVAAIEAWRARHGAAVREWVAAAAEIEALTALSGYAYEHPGNVFPEFVEGGARLNTEELAHPLLPGGGAVGNELRLGGGLQMLVVSGPNMAGKSTFLRGVGLNVVLALAGAPVRARRMVLPELRVAASICVLDSLQGGLSRFYAEILRLKQINDLSRGTVPVLFLLDELLSGTNSHDRRVGTEAVVRGLLSRGAIGLVTTHDLALAEIAEGMEGRAANFHFADRFEGGELLFDYKLTPGVVQTANALRLMRGVGLEV